MLESRRRSINQTARRLKACETALDNARVAFAAELHSAVNIDGASLGEVAKTLTDLGRPMSRQRVHQIIYPEGGLNGAN